MSDHIYNAINLLKRKTEECVGDKNQCEKPAAANFKKTIILAIVIPIAVVSVIFLFIILHIRRKNKKESLEDNDPQYVGSLDFYEQKYYQPAPTADAGAGQSVDYARDQYYQGANTMESLRPEMESVPLGNMNAPKQHATGEPSSEQKGNPFQ